MPTTLPLAAGPRQTLQQSARFGWLMMRERYLSRWMHQAMIQQSRIGILAGGGRLLDYSRRWLACHTEIAALLGEPERDDAIEVRAILTGSFKVR